jgi:ubiquinone/menaquinone biosynthesis C-methylase UbiE
VRRPLWIITLAAAAIASACRAPAPATDAGASPAINERWRSEDIEPLVESLETESREVYEHRAVIAATAGPRPGSSIADVGAGSGIMIEHFTRMVGPAGRVYAVDINAPLMAYVAQAAAERGLGNVETVVCDDRAVNLPRGSIDMAFICDTYHHFEHPRSTMRSIHAALRRGGQVVIVDFDRIPNVSRPWILEHVRCDRATVIAEMDELGFDLVNVHALPVLAENYVLRFRKRG